MWVRMWLLLRESMAVPTTPIVLTKSVMKCAVGHLQRREGAEIRMTWLVLTIVTCDDTATVLLRLRAITTKAALMCLRTPISLNRARL